MYNWTYIVYSFSSIFLLKSATHSPAFYQWYPNYIILLLGPALPYFTDLHRCSSCHISQLSTVKHVGCILQVFAPCNDSSVIVPCTGPLPVSRMGPWFMPQRTRFFRTTFFVTSTYPIFFFSNDRQTHKFLWRKTNPNSANSFPVMTKETIEFSGFPCSESLCCNRRRHANPWRPGAGQSVQGAWNSGTLTPAVQTWQCSAATQILLHMTSTTSFTPLSVNPSGNSFLIVYLDSP